MTKDGQPKQKTRLGYEIPIPKRGDFFRVLDKAAQPLKRLSPRRRPDK